MLPNITLISGAKKSWISSMEDRFSFFWDSKIWMRKIPKNPHDRLVRYDQKTDGSCTVFASCGAMCNNTGLDLTNEQIREIAVELGALDGANCRHICKEVAKMFGCNFKAFKDPEDERVKTLLEKGYEIVVVVRTDKKFFEDGLADGKIDTFYLKGKDYNHAMRLKELEKNNNLVNSWGGYVERGHKNEFIVDTKKMVDEDVFSGFCYLIW